jgi:hypothetical protein
MAGVLGRERGDVGSELRAVRRFREAHGAATAGVFRLLLAGGGPASMIAKVFRQNEPGSCPREVAVYRSGVHAEMPPPCSAPKFYGYTENGDGTGILWLEDLGEQPDRLRMPMSSEEYRLAGEALGGLGGRWASAPPGYAWLATGALVEHGRRWLVPEDLSTRARPGTALQRRLARTAPHTGVLLDAFAALPRTLCHQDPTPRNIAIPRRPGPTRVVLLDWETCGLGPLGQDVASLVWSLWRFAPIDRVLTREDVALQGYLDGVERAGVALTARVRDGLRLAYLTAVAVRFLVEIANMAPYPIVSVAVDRLEEALAMVKG